MVTTDTTQLNKECNSWREHLRSYRNEMSQLRDKLQLMASGENDKEVLTEVEHYHNQFYIQQINIHDLKQAIKHHDRRLQIERDPVNGYPSEAAMQEHEDLHGQYELLEHTLNELKNDFSNFIAKA
nr:hypothetical protein [uncultured Lacibacter sp.]